MSIIEDTTKRPDRAGVPGIKTKRFPRFDMMPSVPETVSKTASKLRTSLLFHKPTEGDPYCRTPSSTELFEASSDFSLLDLGASPQSPTRGRRRAANRKQDASDPFSVLDSQDASETETETDLDRQREEHERPDTTAETTSRAAASKTRRSLLSRWQQSSGVF